jgi:hypothetical protein
MFQVSDPTTTTLDRLWRNFVCAAATMAVILLGAAIVATVM